MLAFDSAGLEAAYAVVRSGDVRGELARTEGMTLLHELHMFTWPELKQLISGRACELVDASAANFLSVLNEDGLAELTEDRWERFMSWEEQACRSPGALDAGTHILVALRRDAA
jgi:hypothetical protein